MSEPDTNAGGTGSETGNSTDQTSSEPSAAYKGLQRKLGEKDNVIQELARRVRELEPLPSAQEELTRERAARAQLEQEVQVERLKRGNPELADVIDLLSSNGVPSGDVIEALKTKLGSAPNTESSGLRNNPARPPQTESEKMDEILRNGHAF